MFCLVGDLQKIRIFELMGSRNFLTIVFVLVPNAVYILYTVFLEQDVLGVFCD